MSTFKKIRELTFIIAFGSGITGAFMFSHNRPSIMNSYSKVHFKSNILRHVIRGDILSFTFDADYELT